VRVNDLSGEAQQILRMLKGRSAAVVRAAGTTGPFGMTGSGTGGDGQLGANRGGRMLMFTATRRRAQRDRGAVGVRCP